MRLRCEYDSRGAAHNEWKIRVGPGVEPVMTKSDPSNLKSGTQVLSAAKVDELVAMIPKVASDEGTITVESPFTASAIGDVPRCSQATVVRAVHRARAAQTLWAERSFRDRSAVFLKYHDLILERQDEILDLIQLEAGKARKYAFEEVAAHCRHEHGIFVMSVPQKSRLGPKASYIAR